MFPSVSSSSFISLGIWSNSFSSLGLLDAYFFSYIALLAGLVSYLTDQSVLVMEIHWLEEGKGILLKRPHR